MKIPMKTIAQVVIILGICVAVFGNPICPECPKGHFLSGNRCQCLICPNGTYNNSPGRATRCEPCRKLCHDWSQTIKKECAVDHDIICVCPAGKYAPTQEDMCYEQNRPTPAMRTERPTVQPGPTDFVLTKPVPPRLQTTPSPTDDSSRSHPTRLEYIIIGLSCGVCTLIVLAVCLYCIWTKCHLSGSLKRTLKVNFTTNKDDSKEPERTPLTRAAELSLQQEFMLIAEQLSPNKIQMFLRYLPGTKLTDPCIEDLKQRCNSAQEFTYQGLAKWLQCNAEATREQLICALESCKENRLAKIVKEMPNQPLDSDGIGAFGDSEMSDIHIAERGSREDLNQTSVKHP